MNKYSFNEDWTIQKDGENEVLPVNLPHDAMIYEERRKDSKAAGACGYFIGGKYIYRKNFEAPEEWNGKTILLEFEGIYQDASIYLNGDLVDKHFYGYTGFYVDLSKYLVYGQDNLLEVVANNADVPNSRWYSGSGIYREVHLYVAEKSYILPERARVSVLSENEIQVDAEVNIAGDEKDLTVIVKIYDPDGKEIAQANNHEKITISNAKLWDEDHINLYSAVFSLKSNEAVVDEYKTKFGIRTLTWNKNGFFVNGKETLLRGACIHHDNGILGACAFRDAEYRKVRQLKEAGFNAIRSSHNPASKAMLDACDELGMYMMDETFDMWLIQKNPFDYGDKQFLQDWKKDTEAMILKDYNHPSVIMYSVGNEISELGLAEGQKMAQELTDYVKSLDSSRAVTSGINLMLATMAAKGKGMYGKNEDGSTKDGGTQSMDSAPTSATFNMMMNKMGGIMDKMSASSGATKIADELAPIFDISGYNYATSRYEKETKKYPDRVIIGSETLPMNLCKNWKYVEKIPNLIGDFMWTGYDYLGESGIGTVRYMDKKTKNPIDDSLIISGGAGIIDICGKSRPEVGWGKLIWKLTNSPVIAVDPVTHADHFTSISMWRNTDAVESWAWPGCEGKKTTVTVYANGDKAELFVGSTSLGKKKIKDYKASFKKVPYENKDLSTIIYDKNGKKIAETSLKSCGKNLFIKATPDKLSLKANGQDLCYVDIDLVDENGTTVSSKDCKLTIEVDGAATLQGFGSARPTMSENFVSNSHTTYYGKALAAIRATSSEGLATVSISGDNLEIVKFNLKTT